MEIIICKTKEEASRKAADLVAALIKAKPKAVLGLATGSTPVPMYQYLAKDCAAGAVLILSIASATVGAIIFLPRLTLAQTYGREGRSLSPVPTQASYDWASGNTAINFVDPVSGKPAKLHGDWDLRGFQVSVDGGNWKWAEKSFVNEKMFPDTVFVEGQDGVHTNVCVRYAWDDYPDCSLVSADGLPVGPFELKATILDFEERAEEVHAETAEPNPHADSAEN